MNNEIDQKIKETLVQAKISLFLTLLSIPFMVLGLILSQTSSFAAEVLGMAVVAFIIYLPLTIYWYHTWKKLIETNGRE